MKFFSELCSQIFPAESLRSFCDCAELKVTAQKIVECDPFQSRLFLIIIHDVFRDFSPCFSSSREKWNSIMFVERSIGIKSLTCEITGGTLFQFHSGSYLFLNVDTLMIYILPARSLPFCFMRKQEDTSCSWNRGSTSMPGFFTWR